MGDGNDHLPIKTEFGLYSVRFGKILFNLAAVFFVLSILSVLSYFVAPLFIFLVFVFAILIMLVTLGMIFIPFPDYFTRLGEFTENTLDIAGKAGSLWLAFTVVALAAAVLFIPFSFADRRSYRFARMAVVIVISIYCIVALIVGGIMGALS